MKNPFKRNKRSSDIESIDNVWWPYRDKSVRPVWRDESGIIRCLENNCQAHCNDKCPIWLNKQLLAELASENYENAISIGERAIEIVSDFADLWNNLASCYCKIGNNKKAQSYYNQALEINPNNSEAIKGLAIVASNIQEKEENDKARFASMSIKRAELIKRLEDISLDETDYEMSEGAMCYSMAPCPELNFECDECGRKAQRTMYNSTYESMHDAINEMCDLGYDAKLCDLCLECMISKVNSGEFICNLDSFDDVINISTHWDSEYKNRVKDNLSEDEIIRKLREECSDKVFLCFFFRTDSSEKYHMIQSNYEYCYEAVLQFLRNNRSYIGGFGRTHLLRNEIDLIERMTGLTIK